MAVTNLWDDVLIEASNYTIEANKKIALLTSVDVANSAGANSLRITMQFEELMPSNLLLSGELGIEVHFKDDNGVWRLLPAYQGNWIKKDDQAPARVVVMQPNISQLDPGVTDVQFSGPLPVCEISRHQGTVPSVDLRVLVCLVEGNPAGPAAWDSVKISGEIDLYSV